MIITDRNRQADICTISLEDTVLDRGQQASKQQSESSLSVIKCQPNVIEVIYLKADFKNNYCFSFLVATNGFEVRTTHKTTTHRRAFEFKNQI
jgi:hypothetical protein